MSPQNKNSTKSRRRPRLSLFQNEAGVTFVEALAAAGIFSIGVLGLSMSLVQMGKARSKTAIVNSAVSLDGYITEGIANPDSYPTPVTNPSLRTNLRAGTNTGLSMTINFSDANGVSRSATFTPSIGGTPAVPLFFNKDLGPCASSGNYQDGNLTDESCAIMAVLDFQGIDPNPALGPPPAGPPYIWRAAYHIEINPLTNVNVGTFGSQGIPDPVASPNDYKFPMPDLVGKTTDQRSCDPATSAAVMGVNKFSGEVTCLLKPDPADQCPPDRFPTGFTVIGNQMVLNCSPTAGGGVVARTFTCPADYALNTLPNTGAFDPRTPTGTIPQCVWTAQATEPARTPPNALSISAQLCARPPSGVAYTHGNPCALVQTQTNGTCCTIPGCTTIGVLNYAPTVPPTTSFNYPQTDTVNCSVTNNAQPRNAACVSPCPIETLPTWTAVVTVGTPTCTLTKPVNQNATATPP